MTVVAKVWIDEDCITCDACQDIAPEVFEVTDETSQILAAVRVDGGFDRNEGKSPLSGDFGTQYADIILEAAEACPVEVIKFELIADGAETEVAAEAPAVEAAVEAAPAAVAVGGAASEELTALMGGDRSLTILFGSQTGNAAGLAEKTAKLASNYGLEASVVDMDGYDKSNLANIKRLLVITSTWGEGEMPDNAEELWQSVQSGAPALSAMHYSVCAIGDTSYDEFCKAGLDWDDKLSSLGASSVQEIKLCDVDYEPPWVEWVQEALPRIACVDDSGTLQLELVEEMKAYGTSDDDDVVEGDFAPGVIDASEIEIELELFRYCPSLGERGWDVVATSAPASASLEDLLITFQRDVDGSFAFRRGVAGGTATTGVRVNGRVVLSDIARVGDIVSNGRLKVEPLPGYPVIRDLIVDTRKFEENRSKANPWMQADPREGERLISGQAVGVLASETALALHQMNAVSSHMLAHGMSETVDFDSEYEGPGVHLQRWVRINDPRSSEKHRNQLLATLQGKGGIWNEADSASIARQGATGALLANTLNDARSRLLTEYKNAGRHGRLVKWYGRSVKWSGKLNETTLYRQVLGPLGLVSNVFSGVSARMMLGFTRTGGPPIRSLQALLLPPAGVGKIPNMFNGKVEGHHEVVSLFNELDQRF
ncbi:MAG: flavodoxin domain-containing protein [Candidatus Thermoplasmatota archaeon]|nr:flavodoxin domain-containing protein [Candidatus Thermoplasmatota archaeon]